MTCPPVHTAAGVWDEGSLFSCPKKSVSDSTEQVPKGNSSAAPSAELKPCVPAIVLLPPSAPESEEEEEEEEEEEDDDDADEDNCETTETELEKDDKDGREEVIMATCYAQQTAPEPDNRRSLDDLPPPPEIPPFCFDNEPDFPSPPAVSVDLISFGEAEEERREVVTEPARHVECSCEMTGSLRASAPDAMSRKSSNNSLLFDFPESELIGRPAPIVLTMDRSGPVKSVQVVRRSSGTGSGAPGTFPAGLTSSMRPPPTAPKPVPPPPALVGAAARGPPGMRLEVQNVTSVRPRSASDVTFLSADSTVKPGASPWSMSAETGLDGCAELTEQTHDDFSDFPPPPPPLEDESSSGQEDSPWVPLMQRFQLVSDTQSRGDSVSSAHRRSRGVKAPSSSRQHNTAKTRTYTPTSKSSYVEISDELKGAKSETRV